MFVILPRRLSLTEPQYLIVPYGNLTSKPMHPNTRMRVKRGRQFQLLIRVCALLAAMGLLFCCIAINKTSTTVAWIIRVAPAVALLQNTYGIYHLCRAATGRTPASTASYMLFAAMVDTGLLPFFAFSSYLSYLDWAQNKYGWSTLFNDSEMSYKIIYTFFALNCSASGLVLIALVMDIYLATLFRKIAKMPPDMNPLEPNLTSRHGQRHKRNKSSMNVTEKHMSGSTLAAQRNSAMSGRRVPYLHTRTDSADSVTLYGNESARNSRIEMRKGLDENKMDPYLQSNNNSRVTLAPTRPSSAMSPGEHARTAGAGLDYRPARSSALGPNRSPGRSPERSPERPSSWLSYLDFEGVPTPLSEEAEQDLGHEVRPLSPVSAMSSRGPSIDQARHVQERDDWYGGSARDNTTNLHAINNAILAGDHLIPPPDQFKKRSREPLGMNPPTPTTAQYQYQDENVYTLAHATYGALDDRHVLTPTNGNAQHNSRPSSFIGSGGKSRFYGNLRASIGSVGAEQRVGKHADSSNIEVYDDGEDDDYERTRTMQSNSDYSGNFEVYDESDDEGPVSDLNVQHLRLQHGNQNPPPKNGMNVTVLQASPIVPTQTSDWKGVRQISNSTGNDLHAGYAGLGAEFGRGMARRREVSGKVAEEGRSEMWEELEEDTPNKKKGLGASGMGWARFKGL